MQVNEWVYEEDESVIQRYQENNLSLNVNIVEQNISLDFLGWQSLLLAFSTLCSLFFRYFQILGHPLNLEA